MENKCSSGRLQVQTDWTFQQSRFGSGTNEMLGYWKGVRNSHNNRPAHWRSGQDDDFPDVVLLWLNEDVKRLVVHQLDSGEQMHKSLSLMDRFMISSFQETARLLILGTGNTIKVVD
ncbi:MAG: hypothetical protein OXH84_00415 [Gammaproteobacteria bacterium]|nr:hypothetical protein [Gammaproteobacteria bacterium]